jgi:GNAT superfamily N-acetyltransferase
MSAPFRIRPAEPRDGAAIVRLVNGLATFENLAGPDDAAARRLVADAFGPNPPFGVLVAEVEGSVRGYALFFTGYSTFRAARVMWLEDLFVDAPVRGHGIGRALMVAAARIARERGCCRFEWSVLDWNENAQRFYESVGATILDEWRVCRVEGEALTRLGASA